MMRLLLLSFIFSLLFIPILIHAEGGFGVSPSRINIFLSENYDRQTLPLMIWNEGNTSMSFIVSQENLGEFTTFSSQEITVNANSNRTDGFSTVNIVFKKTSGEKAVDGGIFVQPKSSGNGTVSVLTRIKVNIKINQTDSAITTPPYTYSTGSSGSSGGSSNPPMTNNSSEIIPKDAPFFLKIIIALTAIGLIIFLYIYLKEKI